jgi:DNA-binding response OmpR family regulator
MYPDGKQILVVDHDAGRRRLSERVLVAEGFAVIAVPEGFSAIRAAQRGRFVLAIAAASLPGTLDGPTTIDQLRARQPWLKALFIGDVASRPRCIDREREDFIAAPFLGRDLLGGVFELLQRNVVAGGRRDRLKPDARTLICLAGGSGAWRSLVAHLLWEQDVGGSNPLAPTTAARRTTRATGG